MILKIRILKSLTSLSMIRSWVIMWFHGSILKKILNGLECSSDLDLLETSVARVDLAAISMQAPRNHWH